MITKTKTINDAWGIPNQKKLNPKIRVREISTGDATLNLEYLLPGGKRVRESLGLTLRGGRLSPEQRLENKQTIMLAEKIRREHEKQLLKNQHGFTYEDARINQNMLDCMQEFVDGYQKASKNVMQMAMRRFREYITRCHPNMHGYVSAGELTSRLMGGFADYLETVCQGCGASTCFRRVRTIIHVLQREGILNTNPCEGVTLSSNENELTKDILSEEEIELMLAHPHPQLNPEVQRAFICSLYTGLRFCDVQQLTYKDVKTVGEVKYIKIKQQKTGRYVDIPLHASLYDLVGEGGQNEHVFKLPSHTACLKALRYWTQHAGIEKHITWHCARHSFATNILVNGNDLKTTSNLMGHASVRMTEKYLHAVDKLKRNAVDSLRPLQPITINKKNK